MRERSGTSAARPDPAETANKAPIADTLMAGATGAFIPTSRNCEPNVGWVVALGLSGLDQQENRHRRSRMQGVQLGKRMNHTAGLQVLTSCGIFNAQARSLEGQTEDGRHSM